MFIYIIPSENCSIDHWVVNKRKFDDKREIIYEQPIL